MKKRSYINYPVYFNRLWVPQFDDEGELISPKGLEEFIDVTKQFKHREDKKMKDNEMEEQEKQDNPPVPKYPSQTNENEYGRQSSIIRYIAEKLQRD